MTLHLKLFVVIVSLTMAIAACGATPTTTPTSTARPPATATGAIAQPTAAPPKATAAPAAAATNPASAPTATNAPTPTKPVATAAAATPAPVANTPDVIANAQRAVLKQKAFRVRMTVNNGPSTPVSNIVSEYVSPDRAHMTIGTSETIIIKDVGVWQKMAGGQWQSLPGSQAMSASVFAALDPNQIDAMMKDMVIDKFKSLGAEVLDGKPMRTYEYVTITTLSSFTATATSKIWIGVADGLPYKSEGSSTNSAIPGVTSQTTSLYEYDNTIKIEAPI